MIVVRSRAPLRLGLAGGGTDVSPYSDVYGGCVLNATINLYAHCTLKQEIDCGVIKFTALDIDKSIEFGLHDNISIGEVLKLHIAVYLRIVRDFCGGKRFSIEVLTHSDAPPGSGLGSSSTMVVAMLEAYRQLLNLPLGEYDISQLAYSIERQDCLLSGGKQDQYAATFGGFNFMEFSSEDRVIVNPLRIRRYIISELEESLLLFYTGASRESASIIEDQKRSLQDSTGKSLEAMHKVKESSFKIKEYLLKGDIASLMDEFKSSWEAKKRTSSTISNDVVERIETVAMSSGARSLKVSGAGGGGFMMIFVKPENKSFLKRVLQKESGQVFDVQFINEGCFSWTV